MEALTSAIDCARKYLDRVSIDRPTIDVQRDFIRECIRRLDSTQSDRQDLITRLVCAMGSMDSLVVSLVDMKLGRVVAMSVSSFDLVNRHKGIEQIDWQYMEDGSFVVALNYFWKISQAHHADLKPLVGAIYAGWCVLQSEIKCRTARANQDRALTALAELSIKVDEYELESDQTSEEDRTSEDLDYFVI
jgi:hypothetical protein